MGLVDSWEDIMKRIGFGCREAKETREEVKLRQICDAEKRTRAKPNFSASDASSLSIRLSSWDETANAPEQSNVRRK